MSDLAIVLAVAFICAAVVAALWLQQRERAIVRAEQRDERETGVIAQLKKVVEENEKAVKDIRSEQKQFLANARSR